MATKQPTNLNEDDFLYRYSHLYKRWIFWDSTKGFSPREDRLRCLLAAYISTLMLAGGR